MELQKKASRCKAVHVCSRRPLFVAANVPRLTLQRHVLPLQVSSRGAKSMSVSLVLALALSSKWNGRGTYTETSLWARTTAVCKPVMYRDLMPPAGYEQRSTVESSVQAQILGALVSVRRNYKISTAERRTACKRSCGEDLRAQALDSVSWIKRVRSVRTCVAFLHFLHL